MRPWLAVCVLALGCGSYVAAPDEEGSGGAQGLDGSGGEQESSGGQSSSGGAEPGTGGAEATGGQVSSGGSTAESGGSASGGEPGAGGAASGGSDGSGGAAPEPVVLWSEGYSGDVSPDLSKEWVSASINWNDDNCPTHASVPIYPGDETFLEIAPSQEALDCIGAPGSIPVMHFGPHYTILDDGPSGIDVDDPSLRARLIVESFTCESSPTKHCAATFRWELISD